MTSRPLKIALFGFVLGAFLIPLLVTLGLISQPFELLKPLTAPGRWAAAPFQNEWQVSGGTDPATGASVTLTAGEVTPLGWVAFFLVNGLVYALAFGIVGSLFPKKASGT